MEIVNLRKVGTRPIKDPAEVSNAVRNILYELAYQHFTSVGDGFQKTPEKATRKRELKREGEKKRERGRERFYSDMYVEKNYESKLTANILRIYQYVNQYRLNSLYSELVMLHMNRIVLSIFRLFYDLIY